MPTSDFLKSEDQTSRKITGGNKRSVEPLTKNEDSNSIINVRDNNAKTHKKNQQTCSKQPDSLNYV